MKRVLFLLLLAALMTAPAVADHTHWNSDGMRSCDDWNVSIDDDDAIVTEETFDVPMAGQFSVIAARNGGISVIEGTGSSYHVTLCKAVSRYLGRDAMNEITLERSGNEVSVDAPGNRGWSAYFIIEAPRGADLRLRATNGPIGVRNFDGNLDAKTVNGPLTLDSVSGTIDGSAVNGPVRVEEASGDVNVETTNGPLTVKIDEMTWNGQQLEAHTTNGPLTLKMPRGFASSFEISARGHNNWDCSEELCGEILREIENDREYRSWNRGRKERVLRVGGNPVVKMSTKNGPVSIDEF